MGRGEPGCEGKELGSGILSVGHLLAPQRCQEGLWMYFERGKYFRTSIKMYDFQDFRCGTSMAVQWLRLHLPTQGGEGSIPGGRAKIPHASQPKNQNIEQKCKKFNKDLKFFCVPTILYLKN